MEFMRAELSWVFITCMSKSVLCHYISSSLAIYTCICLEEEILDAQAYICLCEAVYVPLWYMSMCKCLAILHVRNSLAT